jgi:hypothetical protein
MTTTTATKKATARKPAAKATTRTKKVAAPVPATRADKAAVTRAASTKSTDTQACKTCGVTKPIGKFPTTGHDAAGNVGRGKECRACRDARWTAAKA